MTRYTVDIGDSLVLARHTIIAVMSLCGGLCGFEISAVMRTWEVPDFRFM